MWWIKYWFSIKKSDNSNKLRDTFSVIIFSHDKSSIKCWVSWSWHMKLSLDLLCCKIQDVSWALTPGYQLNNFFILYMIWVFAAMKLSKLWVARVELRTSNLLCVKKPLIFTENALKLEHRPSSAWSKPQHNSRSEQWLWFNEDSSSANL